MSEYEIRQIALAQALDWSRHTGGRTPKETIECAAEFEQYLWKGRAEAGK